MSRSLRGFLLGCIAITFAYLLLHAREPPRLNVGDPSSDANVLSSIKYVEHDGFIETLFTGHVDGDPLTTSASRANHAPPLVAIIYGAAGKYLGAGDIATFRMLALAFSALAMWLLFQYARRIWSDSIALLGTALVTTSLLWMTHADSLYQAPIMQASSFLALWGLVRAIETRQRRHYAAALFGAWASCLASSDDWLVLPAAMLFTLHVKLGNPFARGNRRFVVICAAGWIAGILANRLFVVGAGRELAGAVLAGGPSALASKLASPVPTLIRRYTVVLTPMFWITVGYTAWRALRAPSLRSVLSDGVTWMVLVAGLLLWRSSQPATSQLRASVPLLLFYAIGSAILIERLLAGRRLHRALALAWVAAAPAWSFYLMLGQPRSTLDRDDVAKVNAYLASNDRNDFVMSNLISDGPIQAAFERHTLAALDDRDTAQACLNMMDVLEAAGTDYVHAVIFTTPESRVTDRSLWPLAMPRRWWSMTGWPQLYRSMANGLVGDYDQRVRKNLDKVAAAPVLHLKNFDVYRIDRAAVMAAAGRPVPVVRAIDFGSIGSNKHKLLGWSEPKLTKDERIAVSSIAGYAPCANPGSEHPAGEPGSNACESVLTRAGLEMLDEGWTDSAQLMIRVERVCDLRLTFELASPALLGLSINDFTTPQCLPAKQVSFLIPQRSVRAGINVITLEQRGAVLEQYGARLELEADVASLAIDPVCADGSAKGSNR